MSQSFDQLWIHATLAACADNGPSDGSAAKDITLLSDAAVGVSGDKIAWVGRTSQLSADQRDGAREVRDCAGALVTPGLIDAHTHLVYAGNRAHEFEQRLEGVSYEDIARAGGGIASTVRATREASEADLIAASAPRLQALMAEGVTTVEIKSGYGLTTADEAKMLRAGRALAQHGVTVRTTFLGAHALPPEFADNAEGYIDYLIEAALPVVAPLADAVDAYCEGIGFSVEQVARYFDAAARHDLPVKLHAEQLSNLGGAAMAAARGALSVDHLEYLAPEDVPVLRQNGTAAVLLPGAFYCLRETRVPPIQALREAGVPMVVASDCNPGTSPVTSLLLMMNMACTLFRLTPAETLLGTTRHAARALGLQHAKGSIAVGYDADMVLWDVERPADLSYRVGYNPCRLVMQAGRVREAHHP
ncbi:MAG: imidazolonepropionase [Gammaproteobacteria bacterium]